MTSFVLCADKNALAGSPPSAALCACRGGVRAPPAASGSATASAHAPALSAAAFASSCCRRLHSARFAGTRPPAHADPPAAAHALHSEGAPSPSSGAGGL